MAVVCPNCGAESWGGYLCPNCGNRLPEESGSPTGAAATPGDQAADQPSPTFEAPSYAASSPPPDDPAAPAGTTTHAEHGVEAEPEDRGQAEAGGEVADTYEDEGRGRAALVAVAVLDIVAGALLFAWFVAGGLYGAGRGAGFGFNFGHEFNVAHTDNFGFGSIALFAVAVLSAGAGILSLERSRIHQVGRGLTVALGTFGLATLVRFMQFQLSIHTRAGWGGFAQLVFLFGLFALTFAGLVAAARPVREVLRATDLGEGRLAWLCAFLGLTALLCVTLFFPLFHRAIDPNTGNQLGAFYTHHYLAGTFILLLYLFVPILALLSFDTAFELSLLGGWSLCLVIDAVAAVVTRDAFSSGAMTWPLALRLAVSLALLVLSIARMITVSRAHGREGHVASYYPQPSTSYTG